MMKTKIENWLDKQSSERLAEMKESIRIRRRERYLETADLQTQKARQWQIDNPERNKESKKRWNTANKEKSREYDSKRKDSRREYYGRRRAEDIQYVLSRRLRERIRSALKYLLSGTGDKCHRTTELLGCTIAEFKVYLESKFLPGMKWEVKEKIHIDHIKPVSSFDLTDERQRFECFHYSNLQPLWDVDNRAKSNKVL